MSLRRWSTTLEQRQLHTSINRLLEGESALVDHMLHSSSSSSSPEMDSLIISRNSSIMSSSSSSLSSSSSSSSSSDEDSTEDDSMVWQHRMPYYAQLIEQKTEGLMDRVWGFIDGTIRKTARPIYHQRSVYTRFKKCHGVSFSPSLFQMVSLHN